MRVAPGHRKFSTSRAGWLVSMKPGWLNQRFRILESLITRQAEKQVESSNSAPAPAAGGEYEHLRIQSPGNHP